MAAVVIEIKSGVLWSVFTDESTEIYLVDRDVDELEDWTELAEVRPGVVRRTKTRLGDNFKVTTRMRLA